MNSPLRFLCLLLVCLTGCQSDRAPSFVNSDDIDQLIPVAREVAVAEVNANFGTPSSLVVASYLNVDFGAYSGTVDKVNLDGSLRVRLRPQSRLAREERLSELKGTAVTIADPEPDQSEESKAPDGDASSKTKSASKESPALQVVSFVLSESQDDEDGVLGDLTIKSSDGSAVSAKEDDVVTIVGDTLQHGRNLYLRHCMHCHGVSGDGAGPTAEYFTIKPRDYRRGIFKFTSTKDGVRASRDDLYRIIKLGIPGTYMPSFMLLPDSETRAITEYVRWLAMRGEMERMFVNTFSVDYSVSRLEEDGADPAEIEKEFRSDGWGSQASDIRTQIESDLSKGWTESEDENSVVWPLKEKTSNSDPPDLEKVPAPRKHPTAESIANGRRLFMDKIVGCYTCHGEMAQGNGASNDDINKNLQTGELNTKPGLFDDWGNLIKPRDLTSGIFRGGRRPIDIYRRIHTGIKGTPMPGVGDKRKADEIWDIVNYVLSIPVHGAVPNADK